MVVANAQGECGESGEPELAGEAMFMAVKSLLFDKILEESHNRSLSFVFNPFFFFVFEFVPSGKLMTTRKATKTAHGSPRHVEGNELNMPATFRAPSTDCCDLQVGADLPECFSVRRALQHDGKSEVTKIKSAD